MSAGGAEQREPSSIPDGEGPGLTGLMLSRAKEQLRDLGTDSVLPPQEREHLRLFYTHERNKLQLQLVVLCKTESLKLCESALEEARKSVDVARSERGRQDARTKWQTHVAGNAPGAETKNPYGRSSLPDNPEEDEIRKAEYQHSLAEATLIKARSELQTASAELARLRVAAGTWKEQETAAKRWELSRKWEAITPAELRPAVEAIRHTFEHYGCWKPKQSTMKLCFAALHPVSPNDLSRTEAENLDPYGRFLIALLGPRVERLLLDANHPAPVIFKSYLDVLETALKIALRVNFKEMFEIAKARTDLLGMHPVEWAKRHLQILISEQKVGIRIWIKEVCDPMDLPRAALTEEDIFGGSWRAPRLIHMKPAGNTPYEQAGAWTREDLVRSEELLEARAELLTDFLRIDLGEVARVAHIGLAKQDGARVWVPRQEESNRGIPTLSTPPLVVGAQPPDAWRSLHETFRSLAEAELRLAPHNTGDRWLRAYVDYKDRTIACGEWHLSEGVNESFRERFEVEATRAGIALRSTVSGEPTDVWLHHIFLDLLEHKSKLLFAASKDGGIIVRACEASALYCARLEKQALVEGRGSAMSAVQGSVVGSSSTEVEVVRRDMAPDDPRNETLREAVIKKVQNPHKYKVLSIREAALYFEVRPRTIYRWRLEGDLRAGARRGSITVESVLKLEKRRSRKRRDH
jgi:hypothetical protein